MFKPKPSVHRGPSHRGPTVQVRTVLLAWPTMVLPDEQFIENYRSTVPDIKELTKFGISLTDVRRLGEKLF